MSQARNQIADLEWHVEQQTEVIMHSERWGHLDPNIIRALVNFAVFGYPPGSFLEAVLRNDLWMSIVRADIKNKQDLEWIVRFVDKYIPAESRGTRDSINNWDGMGADWEFEG